MQKYVEYIIKFRWAILLLTPLIALIFAYFLKDAKFDGSYRIWFSKESQSLKKYDDFRAIFGNDDSIIIVFRDENGIFNKKALGVIERLTQKLWQTKYISRVDSLTNYQYVHVSKDDADEILIDSFLEDVSSYSQEELSTKRNIALNEDLLVNRIISSDAKTTMIVGRLTPKAGSTFGASKSIKEAVDSYLKEEQPSGYKFYLAGGPVVNQTFSTLAKYDVTTFTPLVIVIAMLLLWFIFKRFSVVVLTLLVVIFTFIIVLGIQTLLGYKLNNFTANMPVFVIAIGIADAMHFMWVYMQAKKKGLKNYDAIYDSLQRNFLPMFLTSLTTAVGFASLGISEIVPIKTLGIATATAAILAFILTIVFFPAALAIINPKVKVNSSKESGLNEFSKRYAAFIVHYDGKIIFISLILFAFMALGLSRLHIDSNAVKYFREDVPFRETVSVIQNNLTGPMAYEIVVDSKEQDGIKDPQFMNKVEEFNKAFKEKFADVRHISSLVDVVKKFNEIIDNNKSVPQSKNLVAQYLLLYSLSLPQGMELNDKMDVDERLLRVTASMNVVDSSHDLEMIAWVHDWWSKTPYSAEVNGQTAMFANMQHDVTQTLIKSILLAIISVSIVMMFIFRSVKMIPLFIIPNILPIVLVIGAMAWLDITIDLGVAISGAIIIGIAIDDTLHFLVKYKEAKETGKSNEESIAYVMQYAGSAIILTTVVLSLSFIVFKMSQFMLNANFGLITAIALVIAVFVDLILLPAIISRYTSK
ncbi:efflux RND transporter permease subunit [Sulfurimonas sp.]